MYDLDSDDDDIEFSDTDYENSSINENTSEDEFQEEADIVTCNNAIEVQVLDVQGYPNIKGRTIYYVYGLERAAESRRRLKIEVVGINFEIFFSRNEDDVAEEIRQNLVNHLCDLDTLCLTPDEQFTFFGYTTSKVKVWKLILSNFAAIERIEEVIRVDYPGRTVYNCDFDINTYLYTYLGIETFIRISNYTYRGQQDDTITVEIDKIRAIQVDDASLPLRIVSLNVECKTVKRGEFPEATAPDDEIISIGTSMAMIMPGQSVLSESDCTNVIFCLHPTSGINSAIIHHYGTETEMLAGWVDYMVAVNPDIIIGYDTKFDLPLIIQQLILFGISQPMWCTTQLMITSPGTIFINMRTYMQQNFKLRELNAVSLEYLHKSKFDMQYEQIRDKWEEGPEGRAELAEYCIHKCVLPLKLMANQDVIMTIISRARIYGVPLKYIIDQGQQIRITMAMIQREIKNMYIMPRVSRLGSDERHQGATVFEPKCDLYEQPVITLDFASFYPSIMIANNVCYSTILMQENTEIAADSLFESPEPVCAKFVKPALREGILPKILKRLLDSRAHIQNNMKHEEDPMRRALLDRMQLAFKHSANSIYGFTGAIQRLTIPCVEIPASVTAFGRSLLEITKSIIEQDPISTVIYGDTDSVMIINNKIVTVAQAIEYGNAKSTLVSKQIDKSPISLEFKNVYSPFLLMNKKQYAGLIWSNLQNYDKIDIKGIERSDYCEFVNTTLKESIDSLMRERNGQRRAEALIEYLNVRLLPIYKQWKKREGLGPEIINLFVITKEYRKICYKTKQAHIEVAQRMAVNPHALLGEHIKYVIVQCGGKKLLAERAYTIEEMQKNKFNLDLDYYYRVQIYQPLKRILEKTSINVTQFFEKYLRNVVPRKRKSNEPQSHQSNKITAHFRPKIQPPL